MTKQQQRRVIAILKKDCKATGRFLNSHGETCAVGALALAAGYPKSKLINVPGGMQTMPKQACNLIEHELGLTWDTLCDLVRANDQHTKSVIKRRIATVRVVKSLEVE